MLKCLATALSFARPVVFHCMIISQFLPLSPVLDIGLFSVCICFMQGKEMQKDKAEVVELVTQSVGRKCLQVKKDHFS